MNWLVSIEYDLLSTLLQTALSWAGRLKLQATRTPRSFTSETWAMRLNEVKVEEAPSVFSPICIYVYSIKRINKLAHVDTRHSDSLIDLTSQKSDRWSWPSDNWRRHDKTRTGDSGREPVDGDCQAWFHSGRVVSAGSVIRSMSAFSVAAQDLPISPHAFPLLCGKEKWFQRERAGGGKLAMFEPPPTGMNSDSPGGHPTP